MGDAEAVKSATGAEGDLMAVARMFAPYRDDPVMRELCRLAVKCVQLGWLRFEVPHSGE